MTNLALLPERMLLRIAVGAFHRLRCALWFFTRPRTFGVRVLPFTPQGGIVLVRHTYLPGWHLPGGGRKRGEDAFHAALRELREEIGMTSHGRVRLLATFARRLDFKWDTVSMFVAQDVTFRPRRSIEIEAIEAFDPAALPEDTNPGTRRAIVEWLEDGAIDPRR